MNIREREIEFYVAALSILSSRGEMAGLELKNAIDKRNKTNIAFGAFYSRMDVLEKEGSVTSEQRPAPTEETRKMRGDRLVRYFRITDTGLLKRTDYAELARSKGKSAPGSLQPLPA